MTELRWLREEPKSHVFFFFSHFFFFLSHFKFCFLLRPKAEAISTKIACNHNGYGCNKLPPSPTHRRGGGNRGRKNHWSKTRTKRPGAENQNKISMKLATKRKHLPKTQEKTQQWEKPKKPKSVVEAPEKANPPRRPLTIPEYAYHRTQPRTKVNVPEPYRPGPRG